MKIALIGYGKMGKEIEQIAIARGHKIVLKVDAGNAAFFSDEQLGAADVAIEFSTPGTAVSNILRCFKAHVPVVVGTTGWLSKLEEIKAECNHSSGAFFYASNYSIGVNLFFAVNEYLAQLMNGYADYEVAVEEIHHVHKKDAPSGTGLTIAKGILAALERKTDWVEGATANTHILPVICKREGEVPGTHSVRYSSINDEIEIKHVAHNRKGFALGAILAAEWIKGKSGTFGMSDLMGTNH